MWINYFKEKGQTALLTDSNLGKGINEVIKAIENIMSEELEEYAKKGITERPYLNYRTLSDSEWNIKEEENTSHPWKDLNLGTKKTLKKELFNQTNWFLKGINNSVNLKIYGPEWFNSFNTTAPYGQNDGALWQGKGYNTSLTLGARFEALGFEITLKPQDLGFCHFW